MSKLEIEYLNIDQLIPYKNNPRDNEHAVEFVANSIKEFGFKNPIIIDENNVIVAGHTRLKAGKQLGLDKVPIVRAKDLTHEQVNAFRIADNKTAEFADWDFERLEAELEELEEIDMGDFGIRDADVAFHNAINLDDDLSDYEPPAEKEPTMLTCPGCGYSAEEGEFLK